MKPIFEITELAKALRGELAEYGALLFLLNEQRSHLSVGSVQELLQNLGAVSAQVDVLASVRWTRATCAESLAKALGEPPSGSLQQLSRRLPPHYQSLIRLLIDEINDLLQRAQARLQENRVLMRRVSDSMLQTILALAPPPNHCDETASARIDVTRPARNRCLEVIA